MKLVIDTNIVFSLFKSNPFTNKLLKKYKLKLFAPKKLIEELQRYSEEVCLKAKVSKEKFLEDISLLPEIIEFRTPLPSFKEKAKKLILDKEDAPFLALAMEINIPIWSNDTHFKQQPIVETFTTKELAENLLKGEKESYKNFN